MLFNSYQFLFGFLPITLAAFFLLGWLSRAWALRWIILASLGFYAWWRPLNLLIILPSMLVNFGLARALQRLVQAERTRPARLVLLLGIAFNVAFLGYFKYANFFAGAVNDVFGTDLALSRIILPLGISFITFQKIAFLIDVHARRVEGFTFQDYCLFVLFFPQLIAGPIVHYREMMPQFHRASCKPDPENLSVGATLFAFGLFKKVFLADSIAPFVSSLYGQAEAGHAMALVPAWMAAVGFTLQIYFDFSGYTDMALGLGRMIGVRFPPNFSSPLKASSIIDFWLRWHMTLTRFLTAYIYNPLVLTLTRRRMVRGRPSFGGHQTTLGAFLGLLMFPTVLTMTVSGLWHGAGYLFILWGLVHGLFLTVNHAWRLVGPKLWRDKASYARFMGPTGFVLTFVSVAAAMVLFRSTTVGAAAALLKGMIGLEGLGLSDLGSLKMTGAWIALLAVVAFGFPNSLQVLARQEPALGVTPPPVVRGRWDRLIEWSASPAWAIVVGVIVVVGVLRLGNRSEFLYWQF